jgi:hypothetical protein
VLHVWAPGKTGLQQVRREVAAAYTARGLKKVRWQSTDRLLETLGGGIESLRRNEEPALDEDELLVFPEAAAGWIAVKSSRFEWTLPGHHPLALALSAKWDVLGVTSVAGQYVEYTLYRGGRPAEMTLVGTPPTPGESLPPLNLTWFGDKGALATPSPWRRPTMRARPPSAGRWPCSSRPRVKGSDLRRNWPGSSAPTSTEEVEVRAGDGAGGPVASNCGRLRSGCR